jgi:3-phosphoinositide dependent protein kinase-1
MEGYEPLKAHPFFESIMWENLHQQTPPKLTAYLPAMSEDDEDCYGNVSQHLLRVAWVGRTAFHAV